MAQDNILEVKNVSKIFDRDLLQKKQTVLDDISFDFPEGKCTALMGHNGAGKTTTIRIVFGLIKPDRGQILFRKNPIRLEDKRSIGYMPETNKLPLNLTCEEILWHQLRVFNPRGIPSKSYGDAIEASLREINLWEHRKKKVGNLSKGMGRRLSWAQATIHKPDLIILDEPMSGLDPLGHRLMSHLIQKLREKKTSIILCTHELWSIPELCDEVHIIQKGKLCFSTLSPTFKEQNNRSIFHQLSISGINQETIRNFHEEQKLPIWQNAQFLGQKAELSFADYADASKWLSFCLAKGLVIVNFKKTSALDEQNLIRYFSEDLKI